MERNNGSDPPGTRIADRYRVVAPLGRGGMGRVYRAVDETTGKRIALKRAMFPKDKEAKLAPLFEREYRTLAVLEHPCIIRVHDFGRDERGPYYTMELLEGQDLRELSPLPYRDACRYLRDVASSLALLHARRLVHRDVSPGNVRIGGDDRAKLIDFGALSSFGKNRELIGTPPCVPPEAVRAEPLDQRSDLYAFGAVLYYALTGRHAYTARDMATLHGAWATPPVAPSRVVAGIPSELDDLVLALLSLDPIARPSSAAAVIDQLSVIAELPNDGEQHLAEAYLRSAEIVGRERELRKLDKRLSAMQRGRTELVLWTGPSGSGKTRLLSELALRARLAGVTVLHAAAESHREPYGVARKVALDLLDVAPELATRMAGAYAGVLVHVLPELRERLPEVELERLPNAGPERRARLQRALAEWLLEVLKELPCVITVDNIEHADDSSVACIASLARAESCSLLIALTLDDAHPRASAIAEQLPRDAALPIAPLLEADVLALMRCLFGEVAHLPRFARVLFDASRGNPGLCLQLARHLIRTGHVQYSGGAWVLPQEISRDLLPAGIEDVQLARFHKLDVNAREVGRKMSVGRIGMTVPLVAKLSAKPERDVLRALDELVLAELVTSDDGVYRFGYEPLRLRIVAELDAPQRQAVQRILAAALHESDPNDPALQLESGFQLLQAGDALAGARRMAQAATKIAEQHAHNRVLLDAMERALEAFEAHGAPEAECLMLRAAIATGAFRVDPRIATRYGLPTMARLQRFLGLSLATKLAPFLGAHVALRIGMGIAALRQLATGRPRGELRAVFQSALSAWTSLLGVAAVCMDRERIEQLMAPMRVIAGFGPRSFTAFVLALGERMRAQTYGQELLAEQLSHEALEILRDERVTKQISQALAHSYRGGVLFGLGLTQVFRADDSALRTAQALNALGFAMYEVVGAQIALIAHAYRGETEVARGFQQQVEMLALRGGSTWQSEIFILANMLAAHYFTGDVVQLKHASLQLARLSGEIPTLSVYAGLAVGITQLNRGRYAEAAVTIEGLLKDMPPRQRNGWALTRACLAAAYTGSGQPERAEQLCHETVALYGPAEREFPLMYAHVERELARAEHALGRQGEACERNGALIQRFERANVPLLLGLLHRDAAEMALARGETVELTRQLDKARECFRLTTNAQLIASVERIAKRAERAQGVPSQPRSGASKSRTEELVQELLEHTDFDKRASTALGSLVESSAAGAGFLVLFADGAPYVAAAVHDGDPPSMLLTASSALREGDSASVTASVISDSSTGRDASTVMQVSVENEVMSLHPFVLTSEQSRRGDVVGVVWLAQRPGKPFAIDRSRFEASAQALQAM